MAGRRQDLETRIVAKDDASKVIDKVAGELDDLEKRDTTIELDADDQASPEIRSLSQLLAGLSEEDKTIVLKAKATDAERAIDRILRSLTQVDRMDDQEIEVRVEALGDARAELDRIQAELRDIDGTTADATVDVETRGLDRLEGAMSNLPGQLGAITSALGPGGTIVGGVGALVGGLAAAANSAADMAVSARTMSELTGDSVEDVSRLQQVWKTTGADVNDLNDIVLQMVGVLQSTPELAAQLGINLQDGATGGERFVEVMEKLRDHTGDASEKAVLMSQLLGEEGARQGAKLLAVVDDIGASMESIPEGLIISDSDVDNAIEMKTEMAEMNAEFQAIAVELGQSILPLMTQFVDVTGKITRQLPVGKGETLFGFGKRDEDAINGIIGSVGELEKQYTRIGESSFRLAADFGRTFGDAGVAASDFEARVAASVGPLEDTADAATEAGETAEAALRLQAEEADRAAAKVRALEDSYRALRDELTDREAFLGVQDAFDQVTQSAQSAWDAAKAGADDADAKARDHERSLIDLKQSVIDYGVEVLKLPKSSLTRILADIDQGSFDEAETELDELAHDRLVRIWFQTQGPGSTSSGATPVPTGLSAGPMAAGVTPMAGPTLPTLMLPVSGAAAGGGQPSVVHVHTHRNAAVIGAPYDVARAVEEATRRNLRLMPVRA